MTFGENVDPTAAIRAIIQSYPFSVGILREIIQNSEDAGATHQVFILDHRRHPDALIYDKSLSEMQGPALLAYNNALFHDKDWRAVQNIYRSSKKADASKIGKYGIGFRACYHVTDGPQILSGESLAVLDPLHKFSETGGIKLDNISTSQYVDHLSAFSFSHFSLDRDFKGTTIRLPLRITPSSISTKIVTPSEIRQLLMDFITEEIQISLLFLENIKTIEVYEVDYLGHRRLAKVTKCEKFLFRRNLRMSSFRFSMEAKIAEEECTVEEWCILEASSSLSEAKSFLVSKVNADIAFGILQDHKLCPSIAMAIPLSILTQRTSLDTGRLFTFLPLPLYTHFPVHIHGLFALTPSREKLKNREERSLVADSPDQVLVAWNQLLFDQYIPAAWIALLETLRDEGIANIFTAWPPAQTVNQLGDSGYWEDLPRRLVMCLGPSVALWPVISTQGDPGPEHLELDNVLIATYNEPLTLLQTLAVFGLKIIRPPAYILQFLNRSSLTPSIAHVQLLNHISELESPSNYDRTPVILEYLLSDGNLKNIIGLPIIPQQDGCRVALMDLSMSSLIHTMLESNEFELFGIYDSHAIGLHLLGSAAIAEFFRTLSPHTVNVRALTPKTAVGYVKKALSSQKNKKMDGSILSWTSQLWVWMETWAFKRELYLEIQDLCLLPTKNGMKPANSTVFDPIGVHPLVCSCLHKLGGSFFHHNFPEPSRKSLRSFNPSSDVNDLHTLIRILSVDHVKALDSETAAFLIKHLTSCVSVHVASSSCNDSCAIKGHIKDDQRQHLRSMPLFPLALHNARATRYSIPIGQQVFGASIENLPVLPVIQNTTFLDGSIIKHPFMQVLDPSTPTHCLSDLDVLSIALDHFETQSLETQSALVGFMAQYQERINPRLVMKLRDTRFVVTLGGNMESPGHLIDPDSYIAPLFHDSNCYLPRKEDDCEKTILKNLALLGAMKSALTIDIVKERINFISLHASNDDSSKLAHLLLNIIYDHAFDCAPLGLERAALDSNWLPTPNGLLSPSKCRHGTPEQMVLFDRVLSPLDHDVKIPPSLKTALGWDKPLPTSVLVKQLAHTLMGRMERKSYQAVYTTIGEILRRDIGDGVLRSFGDAVTGKAWVPTCDGKLVVPSDAVFHDENPSAGFHKIAFPKLSAEKLFISMGCSERPSAGAILSKLASLQSHQQSESTANKAVVLLRLLPASVDKVERANILVPDLKFNLGPLSSVYYNDIAAVPIADLGDVRYAHPMLDEKLATKLGMNRLGLKFAALQSPGRDLGERPMVTIRNKLREYTEQQFLTEFLANAVDAQATVFGVLVDEYHAPTTGIFQPSPDIFQACPSLVVYNNAKFAAEDFDGICDIGFGSKQTRRDSIGQFGSGALTMFHFTELVMIVSGDKVLFLDPSKTHLPTPDRVLMMSLDYINKLYPRQLASLKGIFEFDPSSPTYNGTLFRLPLRNKSHCLHDSISETFWTANDIRKKIIQPFRTSAHEFLLFTKLERINIRHRDPMGNQSQELIHAVHKDIDGYQEGVYRSDVIHIHRTPSSEPPKQWNIASITLKADITPLFTSLSQKYRLRLPVILAIAAPRDGGNHEKKLFSTLPLPLKSALPVHTTAPYILSSDRRHIRLDSYDNLESGYNQQLLMDVMPKLYLWLLADLLRRGGQNHSYWPGNVEKEDGITQMMVSQFYGKYLTQSNLRVFRSHYTPQHLLPSEAVTIGTNLPDAVVKFLSISRPPQPVYLPTRVHQRAMAGGIETVGPAFIRNEILRNPGGLKLSSDELRQLLDFVSRDNIHDVIGLPLLPLSDGTYVKFEDHTHSTKTYYIWEPSTHNDGALFRADHIVNPDSLASTFCDVGLNVARLKGDAVKILLEEILQEGDQLNDANQAHQELIDIFWSEYPHFELNTTLTDISSFPLVPTMVPTKYISILVCQDQSAVVLSNSSEPPSLWTWLVDLGVTVVATHTHTFPAALKHLFRRQSTTFSFTFQGMLSALGKVNFPMSRIAQKLGPVSHHAFAEWARSKISSVQRTNIAAINMAKSLPIWPSIQARRTPTFVSAVNSFMLPQGITSDMVVCFVGVAVTEYSHLLIHLGVTPSTLPELFQKLQLDTINRLSPEHMESYHRLLSRLLPTHYAANVLVPNSNSVMRQSDTLYARDDLFTTAFGTESQHFVADTFRDLENSLTRFGLRRETDRKISNLKECVQAIHNSTANAEDRMQRARVVFAAYCKYMESTFDRSWINMDNLRFIPRRNVRRSTMADRDLSSYVKDLPEIVAPNEVSLPQFEAVSWTQRAILLPVSDVPDNNVFGHPTVPEVVEHLRVLALQVSVAYPRDAFVLEDIRETYRWLEEHADSTKFLMHRSEHLFLNVNDPGVDTWEWHSSKELLIGIEHPTEKFFPVKSFLDPFHKLLNSFGVQRLSAPRWISGSLLEDRPSILSQFNWMREQKKLTDVVFIAKNEKREEVNLWAHRALLVTYSDYFKDLLTGSYKEAGLGFVGDPIEIRIEHCSAESIQGTLDYIYTNQISEVGWENLLEILELSNYWHITNLHQMVQLMIVQEGIITPDTVRLIKERAINAKADQVVKTCEIYESDNRFILGN